MLPHFLLNVRVPDGAPFKMLTAQWDGEKILSVHYIPHHSSKKVEGDRPQNEVIDKLERLLGAYLSSTPKELAAKPVRFDSLSDHLGEAPNQFEDDVRKAVIDIPCGGVLAYSKVARNIGRPGSYRQVGEACGNNPLGIVVPVFRVVRKRGKGYCLGEFYNGHAHEDEKTKQDEKIWREIKRWFLQHEGCRVNGASCNSRVTPRQCSRA